MIIAEGGYSLLYERNRNRIIIGLPQTEATATNTVSGIVKRRDRYEDELTTLLFIAKLLFEEPETIRAEPIRHGKWTRDYESSHGDSRFMCSVCHCKESVPTCNGEPTIWDYCPNCGALMDEEENEDESY